MSKCFYIKEVPSVQTVSVVACVIPAVLAISIALIAAVFAIALAVFRRKYGD